jgi:hypothetical protein
MNKQQFKEWVSDVVIEKLNPIREEIERLRADGYVHGNCSGC